MRSPFDGQGLGSPFGRRRAGGGGGGEIPLATTTLRNFVDTDGMFPPLSANALVGQFVTRGNDWFAVLQTATNLVAGGSAPSEDIEADGFIGNGAMVNPAMIDVFSATGVLTSAAKQGFDAYLEEENVAFLSAAGTEYDAALNVDPNATGSPYALTPGNTIVKAIRLPTVTDGDQWQTIQKYIRVHVLSEVPPADAYPPSSSATTKTIYRRSQINTACLRSIAMPGSFTDTPAALLALIPDDLGQWGLTGNRTRRMRLDAVLGVAETQYSGELAPLYSKLMMLLHSSATTSGERQQIIDIVARFAIQLKGLMDRGYTGSARVTPLVGGIGAGQSGGISPWLYTAAALFNDADMLQAARDVQTNMTDTGIWVTGDHVGSAAAGKFGIAAQTFFPEQVGMPWIIPDEWGSHITARYYGVGAYISAWEHLPVMLLQSGPSGTNGVTAILDGPFDTTNQRAASMAHLSRIRSWAPNVLVSYNTETVWDDLYDTTVTATSFAPWTGRPDQIPYGNTASFDDDLFTTPADGAIAWNISAYDYATETVTSRDFRYSLDGVQWVEELGVSASGSKTGLLRGAAHWCGLRHSTASGAAPWSLNFPADLPITSGDDRGKRTTTGTATAAAPVNTVAPVIHVPSFEDYIGPIYEPAPASVPIAFMQRETNRTFIAGDGYWSGFPAPTFTYQWYFKDVAIAGALSKSLNTTWFDISDGGLSYDIIADNGVGSPVTVRSATITIPAEVEPAAPTVFSRIDTNATGVLRRTNGLVGATAGRQGTFAFKGKLLAGDGSFRSTLRCGSAGSTDVIYFLINGSNQLQVQLKTAQAGTPVLNQLTSGVAFNVALGEFTLLASWDLTAGIAQIYVNGVSRGSTPTTIVDGDIGYQTSQPWTAFGTGVATPSALTDAECDYMLLSDEFVDWSVSGNRAAMDDPEALGYWGTGATGIRPLVFLWGDADGWNGGAANKGTGGAFPAFTGTFTDA